MQARQGGAQAFRMGRGVQLKFAAAPGESAGQALRLARYGGGDIHQLRTLA